MMGRIPYNLDHERDRRGGQNTVERATKDDRLESLSTRASEGALIKDPLSAPKKRAPFSP